MEAIPHPARPAAQSRSWYSSTIAEFLRTGSDTIVGRLATDTDFTVLPTQRDAWLWQIELLKSHLTGLDGSVFMEFSIPRMGRRVDAVIIIGPVVFVVEFKVGETEFDRAAIEQVWDYALDLKNFHEASHGVPILPILIPSAASSSPPLELRADGDNVYRPVRVRPPAFRASLDLALASIRGDAIDPDFWHRAPYRPTPTIIEAARALYAQHSVESIARYDAGAENLRVTSRRIGELVEQAKACKRKLICFLTGVPGAGKTLVGLNIATERRERDESTHAVFLSGNGPLVAVLREALTRDEVNRQKNLGVRVRKGKVGESVKAFIQNVHHFRDDLLIDSGPPHEHVAIFDEAQRAWTLEQTANFMRRKKKRPGFSQSEPEFLISCMDRHADWAVVVCLVGGGQEINTGEAGIDSWIEAANTKFPHWHLHISSRLIDSEYAAGKALEAVRQRTNAHLDDCLHLAVSMRSFRAERVSHFVKALLDCDKASARDTFAGLADRYPIVMTRDLRRAKQWLRDHARGSERYGMVASSKAHRLKPDAIDIRVDVDPVHWFLNEKEDTRSSFYLEDAATEFQVQGLELDWIGVAWDGDLRFAESGWTHHYFRGDRWCNIANAQNRRYLLNAYRVLLTRARQGMVVYVPRGDSNDPTRSPDFYQPTYEYLAGLGISVLP
jgi:Schlafen group 3, DNA/RNA helicase domain